MIKIDSIDSQQTGRETFCVELIQTVSPSPPHENCTSSETAAANCILKSTARTLHTVPTNSWRRSHIHYIVRLSTWPAVSKTPRFNASSIKYSLNPPALRGYISWHYYQARKWFQSSWHSLRLKAIFFERFQAGVLAQCFIAGSPNRQVILFWLWMLRISLWDLYFI